MKKKLLIPLLITAVLAVGITLAFMFRQSEPIENEFIPAEVSCSVVEAFDGGQKTSIKVQNDSNISCYLRIRLISYWVDSEKQVVGKASQLPTVNYDDANWLYDEENDTYYYKTAVAPNKLTEHDLLKKPLILAEEQFDGETVYQVVQVFAEAVQAEPEKAVREAWPFFAANGSAAENNTSEVQSNDNSRGE